MLNTASEYIDELSELVDNVRIYNFQRITLTIPFKGKTYNRDNAVTVRNLTHYLEDLLQVIMGAISSDDVSLSKSGGALAESQQVATKASPELRTFVDRALELHLRLVSRSETRSTA